MGKEIEALHTALDAVEASAATNSHAVASEAHAAVPPLSASLCICLSASLPLCLCLCVSLPLFLSLCCVGHHVLTGAGGIAQVSFAVG